MRSILRRPSAVYPRQEKTITSSRQQQIVVPDPGYYLSKVIAEKYPDANGTYTAPARSGTNDMGATNNYRYVDTTGLGDTKSATPSANAQEITPDAGRYLSKVIVDATPVQEIEVTAGTSSKVITPDNGKFLSQVTVNPTPSQTKTATPGPQSYGVLPDNGMLLSSVTVLATPTQAKTIAPDADQHIVKPDTGKFLSQVTVQAVASEEKTITASRSQQVVTPSTGKVLKRVIVNKYPDASGTYPATARSKTVDMGATNNYRYVDTSQVPNNFLGLESEYYMNSDTSEFYHASFSQSGMYLLISHISDLVVHVDNTEAFRMIVRGKKIGRSSQSDSYLTNRYVWLFELTGTATISVTHGGSTHPSSVDVDCIYLYQ